MTAPRSDDARRLLEGSAWARSALDVVHVEGPDAATYLQGQLSQDVQGLPVGAAALSFLLEPQGRIVAVLRVVRDGQDAFRLAADAGAGEAVAQRLLRYRLRTKADVRLEAGTPVVAVRSTAPPPAGAIPTAVAALPGWDLPAGEGADADVPGDEVPSAALDELRVAALVPSAADLDERAIPAETGLVDEAASFTKGCYTGQELVARMDSRGGAAPRRLRRAEGEGPAPEPGTGLVAEGGRDAGTLSTIVALPGGWAGLALVPRAVPAGAAVDVGGARAVVA